MEYLLKLLIKGAQTVAWVYELHLLNDRIYIPGIYLLNHIIKNFLLRWNNWLTSRLIG